jgi:hypothetical protein
LWKRVLLSGLLRDRKNGVMCKVDIIDYIQWMVHIEEVGIVGGVRGGGEEDKEEKGWKRRVKEKRKKKLESRARS